MRLQWFVARTLLYSSARRTCLHLPPLQFARVRCALLHYCREPCMTFEQTIWLLFGACTGVVMACAIPYVVHFIVRLARGSLVPNIAAPKRTAERTSSSPTPP